MKPVICSFLILIAGILNAQNYDVVLIPDSLKENANAVKRFEAMEVIIKSPSKAVIKHKWAVTILNEEGFKYSWYSNSYDKLQSLEDISGKLYDASGKHLRSIKKKDISDLSMDDNISLMTDNRIKQFNFYHKQYPYTIEFEDEQTYYGMFYLPSWTPVEDFRYAVQHSQFLVEAPDDYLVRYKQFAFDKVPASTSGKNTQTYSWILTNYKAIDREVYMPRNSDVIPMVRLAPSDFEIQGYKGNMNSWQNLGKFISQLNHGRDVLPPSVEKDIQQLTAGIASIEEKARVIYNYLQKNTRYISIQLGIGGWQPFDASYVATKRYGDCKALSNYMIAMLKAAGVKANYVLITAGEGHKGLIEDFPSPNFNHAIMCVPNGKDTLWLECTSQTESPGYMGSFTGNRKALMITDEGGMVVTTPAYSVTDNLQLRKVTATIDAAGNLLAEVNTHFTGQQQETQHQLIHYFNKEQRDKYLNEQINLPTYKVEASDYKEHKGKLPMIDEYLKISAPSYASITGKRLFIQPNLFNKMGTKLSTEKPRRFDIWLDMSYRDVDTIHIKIPEGYSVEAMPKDVSMQTKWGKYAISFKMNGNAIDVLRINERYAGTYPATEYVVFAKYLEDIYKADRSKMVLVKKE